MAELSTSNLSTCEGFRQAGEVKPEMARNTERSIGSVGSCDIYTLTLIVL